MSGSSHVHPMLVHFPIALITAGFLFDLFAVAVRKQPCLSKTGYWLKIIGMASDCRSRKY